MFPSGALGAETLSGDDDGSVRDEGDDPFCDGVALRFLAAKKEVIIVNVWCLQSAVIRRSMRCIGNDINK